MSTTTQRPTPETDQAWAKWPYAGPGVHANFARKLERERDEVREQLKAMREAVKEAARVIENARFVHQAITTYAPQDAVEKIENQKHCDNMGAALAKLQPFLKP